MPEEKTIFSISENNKGLPCPFKQINCENGKCERCQIYLDWQKRGEMLVICAWCGVEVDRKPGLGKSGVSHGICLECNKKHFSGYLGRNSLN